MGMLNCGVINLITCVIYFMYFEVEPQKEEKRNGWKRKERTNLFLVKLQWNGFHFQFYSIIYMKHFQL